jgi:hypothetical protein
LTGLNPTDPTDPAHPGALLAFKSIEHFENTPKTVIDRAQPAPNPTDRGKYRETRLLIDTNPWLNGFVHDGIDQKLGSLDRRPRLACTSRSENCGQRRQGDPELASPGNHRPTGDRIELLALNLTANFRIEPTCCINTGSAIRWQRGNTIPCALIGLIGRSQQPRNHASDAWIEPWIIQKIL